MSFAFIVEKLAAFFAGPIGRWIVVAALVAAALFAGGVYERDIGYKEGLDVGAKREVAQAKANADAVIALDRKYRSAEAAHKLEVSKITQDFEGKLADEDKQRAADVAAARAGARKLYVRAICPSPNAGGVPGAGANPSRAPEARVAELPPEIAGSVESVGHDANRIVQKLNWCEDLLEADRKLKGTQ